MKLRILVPCLLLSLVRVTRVGVYADADPYAEARRAMVKDHLRARGIQDERILRVMGEVPRHEFVPSSQRPFAYVDDSLPIGYKQTISPPYIVALMTETLHPRPDDRVLEIGTGSGYQAAVLSKLVKEVYTIEIIEPLAQRAAATLKRLGFTNVTVRAGDGYQGWPQHAPFDAIIVTCAPGHVPPSLVDQLKEGGRMVIPVGAKYTQKLYLLEKRDGKVVRTALTPVYFVPMTGPGVHGGVGHK